MHDLQDTGLDSVIHVIQTSLTPIFLLTAVAGLLGVFTTRLARISDQVEKLGETEASSRAEEAALRRRLAHLRCRSHTLDVAVILGALAGSSTCGTVLALFLGSLRARTTATILFVLFGLSICFTIGALGAFLTEMLLAGRGIRAEAARHEERYD